MIVTPDKFQLMLQKSTKKLVQEKLQIVYNEMKSENSVTLLGIAIDNRLSSNDHISKILNKASMQLNVIFRLKKYMSQKELEVVLNSFIYSSFNYGPLVWHFSTKKSIEKIENIHKRCLRLTLNDYKKDYETLLDKSGILTKTQNKPALPEISQINPNPPKTTPQNCETIQNDPKIQSWGNLEFSTSFCFSNFEPKCPNLGILSQKELIF